jgi:hypothetical protein
MSRNKCFSQVRITHVLRFVSVCDLFTVSSSYLSFPLTKWPSHPPHHPNNTGRVVIMELIKSLLIATDTTGIALRKIRN